MTRALTVSIDAMGGDAGPGIVVSALLKTIQRHTDVQFILHGDEAQLKPLLKTCGLVSRSSPRSMDSSLK